ncbi:MAG: DEAD/DEAH box helicase, partial [Solirubrobacterales bacterium]|nr:DEAD/DEAH box helicase [Solirubrobacterales bacterium]
LGLSEDILTVIDELGYEEPSPIQAQAIPELLAGNDVIGQAQTGTGKTAAFGLPLLQYLDPNSDETQAIVLTPTRELCIQVTQALRAYAEHIDINVVAVFGGTSVREQAARVRSKAHVVVATVGRTMDLISRGALILTGTRYVVLDEADEMLDLGFIEDVEKILRMCPNGRQTMLFSATMPPPIARLAETYMYDPVTISITPKKLTVDAIEQAYVEVEAKDKTDRLIEVLKAEEPEQAIVFCRTKIGTARLDRTLRDRGLQAKALHGDMSQGQRDGVMISFKEHKSPLLIATDVAARGLDIEHVTHVINFDLPNNSEIYVHRIGRTGRVGRTGRAITFVTPKEVGEIAQIERDVKTSIGEWEAPEDRIEHAPRPKRRHERRESSRSRDDAPAEIPAAGTADDDPKSSNGAGASGAKAPADRETPERIENADGHVKLFINRGSRNGIEEDDIRWALTEGAVVPEDAIHTISILERFTFVVLDGEHAARALDRLDGTKLKDRQIRLEYAKA